jgi:predicted molibdopterin-dependent oxidoreductase YjgC
MFRYRIKDHPILRFEKKKKVKFIFDGREVEGYEGEPIACALHAMGVRVLRRSIYLNRPRGFFCALGRCSSCLMKVDGVSNIMVCITPLREGMIVETQTGRGKIGS